MNRLNRGGILNTQRGLLAIVGIIVGIILALCFFRVAGMLYYIVSFLFWIAIGIVLVFVVYRLLMSRWRGRWG